MGAREGYSQIDEQASCGEEHSQTSGNAADGGSGLMVEDANEPSSRGNESDTSS